MTCCPHHRLVHAYVTATRDNSGRCLAPGCGCVGFVSDERESA